jgi:xanthine dehydrogenase small subunit
MPALIALDARVVLRGEGGEREIALDAFYPGFRKTARRPGEFIAAVRIPRRSPDLLLRAWKIGKRYDQDISAVFACFALTLENGVVRRARIGCGGVAAVPARARRTEAALENAAWNAETAQRAAAALAAEFTPIDDFRASAAYRREALGNLLLRLLHETRGDPRIATRVDAALLQEASG